MTVAGQLLSGKGEDELAAFRRDHVGIVFQSFHLIPTMTALENVAVPLEFRGAKDAMGIAEDKLKRVGLGHRLTHYPGQLSGGEQQRVAIARALGVGCEDHHRGRADGQSRPCDGGTDHPPAVRPEAAGWRIALLVTHDRTLAERCDRVAEVLDGRIVAGAHP